jgi:carbamoyl-phosphate synthase small subunit
MNCIISSEITDVEELKKELSKAPPMAGLELASVVSTKECYTKGNENSAIRIAVLDYGTKQHIIECMVERGAYVKVFPAKTNLGELKAFNPNGFLYLMGLAIRHQWTNAVDTLKEVLNETNQCWHMPWPSTPGIGKRDQHIQDAPWSQGFESSC